jgi:HupE / UreJ protein
MRAASLVLALVIAAAVRPAMHEIPADVTVQVFVKPDGDRLRLLVRAPLAAMRDVNFPTRGPGYLDLTRADAQLRTAAMLWLAGSVRVLEGSTQLPEPALAAVRVSLPSDRSFLSYDQALVHVAGAPLASDTELVWNQALLDALFEYRIRSPRSRFTIEPAFARLGLRVTTVLRHLPVDGGVRPYEFSGDPGSIALDPRWHQSALRFVRVGFLHILDGIDHLLFLVCLVIPLRRLKPLVLVVTAFTVAHSITLVGSAFGLAPQGLWFPPLVEMLIAMSIVYMAFENIVGARVERRWLIALAFGLVHGFGFSFALRDSLQFAGSHLLTALVSFNVGVELGQLLVLALLVPALHVMFRYVAAERVATILLSALVAHTGWHWMIERGDRLRQFDFVWPALDAAFLAGVLRWAIVVVILAGLVWFVRSTASARRKGASNAASSASYRDGLGAAGHPSLVPGDRGVDSSRSGIERPV